MSGPGRGSAVGAPANPPVAADGEQSAPEALRLALVLAAVATDVSVCGLDTHGRLTASLSSGPGADRLAAAQRATGHGPTLEALRLGRPVTVDDLGADPRFAALSPAVTGSALCVPLPERPDLVLTARSDAAGAFAGAAATRGVRDAATVVALVTDRDGWRRKADNLAVSLQSSRRIGAAVGILMHARKLTEEAAFEALRATSQRSNRKVRDVADDVVLTGTLPEAPPLRRPGAGR